MPNGLAVAGEASRPVGEKALVLLLADGEAEVGARVEAVNAFAALRREERDDVVTGHDAGHPAADVLDNAGPLVPEHGRRVAGGVSAGSGEEVGVADAAGNEANEHLAVPRLGEIELLNLERGTELLQDCCARLHS